MLPRNMTAADALKPPLGAAQVAPPPRQGYFDVMGHFDSTFNCSRGSYIYCCGTCHYRFCCEHQRDRLDQDSCNNYNSPVWIEQQGAATQPAGQSPDPDFETLQQQSSSTAYVIGGVISFTLVVAVGVRIAFSKVARRPRNRDINMPRSLVDILRHQSSPVQQGDRNNTTILGSTASDGRTSKNIYTPVLQRSMRHNTGHPSFSHSFHNLAQLPPSYEAAMKPELSRYSSLKRLEYTLGSRGTLPLHGSRPRLHIPTSTPNPYPLPAQPQYTSSTFDRPPRRVRSQDQLLALGEGNTLSRLSKNQQHQLLVSPDCLEDRLMSMGVMGAERSGMVPTMGRLSHHQKTQSQQNICVTPSLDRHHMIKMNSHPTSGHEHERGSSAPSHWDPYGGTGGHPNARRMAFASKRQNTIEQLHFIPGGGGGQGLRTGSKNEVTV
uniref:Shisa N-terminal domain-containing protein n=1 Tax=Periophthalmus magnuspinnatus TaxID=409849 RepID=A0A3B4BGJ5_9GOBI